MLNFSLSDLQSNAEKLLEMDPDPAPRFRLVRDVLRLDPSSTAYREAESALESSKWIAILLESQQADGTWGRFHTQDTTAKQPFATTENAIRHALNCGLDKDSPVLQKVQAAILDYMSKKTCWPDPPEKHDNPLAWFEWVPQFSAAVLAEIDQFHPRLDEFWQTWAEAVKESFQSGSYDRQTEITALNRLMACRMKNPVPFHYKYPLQILSATANRLPADLERKLLDYVLDSPAGIYYTSDMTGGPIRRLPAVQAKGFYSRCQAHRLLSRFPLWKEMAQDAASWIWAQRSPEGFWDLGDKIARRPFTSFPLSESWKRRENRLIDYSVEMLTLLSKSCP